MFDDRADAGRRLAQALEGYRDADPVVLGLPRGGVPVAFEVARRLDAPLDVILVRKLGVPFQPELHLPAPSARTGCSCSTPTSSPGRGSPARPWPRWRRRGAPSSTTRVRWLQGRPRRSLVDRVALVVDDGVATGATASAACQVARAHGARSVVLAVPVPL